MIINGKSLLEAAPIEDMASRKMQAHGLSYGLSEVGYDIRLKQDIMFYPPTEDSLVSDICIDGDWHKGRTILASAIERFQMPDNLWGELRNKSTIARQFIDATIGTDIEPGWNGFLTLEIIFHGSELVTLPAGMPIAKVVFHELKEPRPYQGKYQNQADEPVAAKFK